MKQKRSIGKPLLSLFMAILLVLQTVMFSAGAYAESVPNDSATEAVSESASPSADEPLSVPEAVYDAPNNFVAMAAVPTDKTAVFMEANSTFPLKVTQGTDIAPGGTIQGRQAFTLKSEGLKVPVRGDFANTEHENDTTKYIQKGDSIELKREDYFKEVVLPTATKTLMATTDYGQKQLGTAYFTPDSIKIVFNGDDSFFNGIGVAVTFGFDTTANSDLNGIEYGDTKPISIFGGAYELKNPDVTAKYNLTLTSPGMRNSSWAYRIINPDFFVAGAITWQSTVSASDQFDNTIKLPLDGKTFYTNPASYNMDSPSSSYRVSGIYVPGSFKVNNEVVEPTIDANGALSYVFPPGTGVDPQVEYKTWIPKGGYYYEHRSPSGDPGRAVNMNGKVELKDGNAVLANRNQEIVFAPDWIQASASYDNPNETITWKITVNQYNKKGLKDLTITNALPAGLDFLSAEWQTWVDGVASEVKPITPDENSVYSFGDINGKVELVIKSKVTSGSDFRIDPRANWNLDTPGGIQNNDATTGLRPVAVTDEAIVTIGAHTFTKSGAVSTEDYNLGAITWTVNLAPQYALPNAVVYDVLVHGGDLNVLDNAVDATGEVSAETIAKIKANVNTAQLWKQYHAGTLKGVTNASSLTMKAIPLTVNGEVVADLIKVTGYTDQAASFSFRALETNPDILFRQDINTEKTRWNRALLFDGEAVKKAENNANLHLRMLNKDMLTASYPIKKDGTADTWYTPNNVNRYIGYDGSSSGDEYTLAGYDRTTKTVTFRLSVNMPGYNTVEMAKSGGSRVITDVKLVDTLPAGWEFVPFSEEKEFELWKGFSDNGSGTGYGFRNNAVSIIEPNDPAHVVNFSHSGNEGTFTFSKLEGPYVILVKARPSNEALAKYLDEYTTNGTDKQVLYNKADLHMTWGGVEKVLTEQRKIIVPIQTLGKSVTKPVPGVLEWTVNYTPPFNMKQDVYLQDTLGAGMNLRYEENGKLVLTAPSMAVYPAKLTASGALEREGAALDLSDPNAEVQVEAAPGAGGTTVLKFKMKNPNKFYQFVYQTEVDPSKAKAGDKMGNEVKLEGDDNLKSVSARSESTLDNSDVAGSSSSNALLPLKKVDPNGNPLKGVEFTLYKKDSGNQIAKGTTDSGGKLNLLFPDPGYYELKETYIDTNTWLPTTRVYQVYVGNTPGKPIWVDGVKVTSDSPLVVPTPAQGKLTITNKVEGNGSDPNKEFEYTVNFTGEGEDGEYTFKKPDGEVSTVKFKSGDKIILKNGESVVFPTLPAGLVYTVTEADYTTVDGYTTEPETRELSGKIENKGDHKADFVNKRYVYNLTVSNTVTGDGAESDKPFKYTVTFDGAGKGQTYNYELSDGTTGTVTSGATFELKHGETFIIKDLPDNLKYDITQNDYKNDGYATTPALSDEGVMAGADRTADFVNERAVSKLTVSNTVMGNGGDKTKEFEYTVIFEDAGKDGSYAYTKSDGETSTPGTIKSGESFTLKDGETLEIVGLPKNLKYTVTQKDYTADEYVTTPQERNHTGVMKGTDEDAPFTNTRVLKGGLLISNAVKGNAGDKTKVFKYTVVFTGEGADESYDYVKSDGTKGKIKSGDTFELTDSQTLVMQGLPTYLEYKVTQDDYSEDGYVTDPESFVRTGSIPAKSAAEAHFVNTRQLPVLEGVLRDNNTGEIIPNAKIIVTNKKTNEQQTIWTNENGEYSVLAAADTNYTITYTKLYHVGGKDVPVEFTQKGNVNNGVTDETVPADITAVGIVLFKQLDGTKELFNDSFTSQMRIYLKDKDGNYLPKAFPMDPNGTFSVEGLSEQQYTMEVRYQAETGEELLFNVTKLNVKANGELNISEALVDPYGTVYDETTGDAITGKKIEGATVTLYYADTQRNRDKGRTPDTKVTLPPVPNFAPHDNKSPEQDSDANGFYAYMVFPEADYYLIVTKDGYETYKSETISVDFDIVRKDVPMKPINTGGVPGPVNPGPDPVNPGPVSPGPEPVNPGPVSPAPEPVNPGPVSPGPEPVNPGPVNPAPEPVNPGPVNPAPEPVNPGPVSPVPDQPGSVNNGTNNIDDVADHDDNGVGNVGDLADKGAGNANNELDDAPQTGDNSVSPIFYMVLALMSMVIIGFCLLGNKKRKHIQ
ncbi:carboxypeptidase regulatory-like domain-containing protein [Paenibacillus sp. JJ-223]|uniref:DUF7601 domain-containing protein n=1 Tax=Paenibacillus sp. JJ-223 TaxID=2905647 RepID=UPI001F868419|nr:carboxypeptidase regulatory-like domain-containing protein [Paenibacillus sp. JJ-223]CAH1197217.1 hypothetical protein PAECIP111890_01186 [Paenibacillus sp. JJ-223]